MVTVLCSAAKIRGCFGFVFGFILCSFYTVATSTLSKLFRMQQSRRKIKESRVGGRNRQEGRKTSGNGGFVAPICECIQVRVCVAFVLFDRYLSSLAVALQSSETDQCDSRKKTIYK